MSNESNFPPAVFEQCTHVRTIHCRERTVVFRAMHLPSQRDVAIKAVPRQPRSTTPWEEQIHALAVERLDAEFRLLSELCSPFVTSAVSRGVNEHYHYLITEMIDGFTLHHFVPLVAPIPDGRAIALLAQLASGIADLHQSGIAHGDLQPTNVMITTSASGDDALKVIDLGLGAPTGEASVGKRDASSQTVLSGTPAYMAPELFPLPAGPSAENKPIAFPARISESSDVYALGCLGYFMLSGQPPFGSRNPIESGWQRTQQAAPPLACPGASEALCGLLSSTVAFDAGERPSLASVRSRLREIRPLNAWSTEDAQRWWTEAE